MKPHKTKLIVSILLFCVSNLAKSQTVTARRTDICDFDKSMIISKEIRTNADFKRSMAIKVRNDCKSTIVALQLVMYRLDLRNEETIKNVKVKILPHKVGQAIAVLNDYEAATYGFLNYTRVRIREIVFSDGSTTLVRPIPDN